MAHVFKRLIHVNNQRIFLAAICHQVVATQLRGIVIGNLLLDTGAFNARICREQLVFTSGVGEVVADIPCHRQLRVQGKDLRIGFTALCHVHAGSCLHIGQEMLALV